MDRGVRAADYQRIVENVASAGIVLRFSVMGYVFDETDAEFEESLRFLAANQERIGIDALELMVSEPGSRLARDPDGFGLSLDTSGALAGNPELSYLAGRVGHPLTVLAGPTRAEALDRLVRVFHTVRPGQASAILPRRSVSGAGSRVATGRAGVAVVRPYPWVRTVPAGVDAAGFPDAKGRGTGDATGTVGSWLPTWSGSGSTRCRGVTSSSAPTACSGHAPPTGVGCWPTWSR